MHILLGLALGVALLYFWLCGHWFARILVFLPLACLGLLAGVNLAGSGPVPNPVGAVVIGLIFAAMAWPLASLPIYWRRYQSRDLDRRVSGVMRVLAAGIPPLPEKH